MLRHTDLAVGTRLLCIESNNKKVIVGNVYTIMEKQLGKSFPYRITNEVDNYGGMLMSLDEFNGLETLFIHVKYVLESSVTKEGIFILRLTGKLP